MSVVSPIQYPADKISRLVHDGVIPPFALDMDFARRGNLDAHQGRTAITYSGGANGTYFDSAGVLQTSGTDAARFDHSPVSPYSPLSLLVEEERTNFCLESEDLGAETWIESGGVLFLGNSLTPAPDGNDTADLLDDTTDVYGQIDQDITVPDDSVERVFSLYVFKEAQTQSPNIRLQYSGGTALTFRNSINTSTGASVAVNDATASDVGSDDADDYWRFWVKGANNGTGNTTLKVVITPAGSGGQRSLEVWGMQVEEGSFHTSYIATTTVAVTRTLDALTMNNVTWHNTVEGTYYFEGDTIKSNNGNFQTAFQIDDGGTTDMMRMYQASNSLAMAFGTSNSGGNNGFVQESGLTLGTKFKFIGAYANNDVAATLDGGTVGADATANHPLADPVTTFRIGSRNSLLEPWNGHIARITYWPRRLPNGVLQDLTA